MYRILSVMLLAAILAGCLSDRSTAPSESSLESPDVATNHDIMYAFSPDEGRTWRKSTGESYALPIVASTAELAWAVPQNHELINQTTMTVDARGRPLIATYWRPEGSDVPQLQLVWRDTTRWRVSQVGTRTEAFRLSDGLGHAVFVICDGGKLFVEILNGGDVAGDFAFAPALRRVAGASMSADSCLKAYVGRERGSENVH